MKTPETTIASHTPGPWVTCEWNCHAATTVKAGDVVVAECSGHGRHSSESLADARLIAAAPDLLRACRAVLAEPFGCPFCDSGKLRNPAKGHTEDCGYPLIEAAIQKAGRQ